MVGKVGVGRESIGVGVATRVEDRAGHRLGDSSCEGGETSVGEGGVGVASIGVHVGEPSVHKRGSSRDRGTLHMHILLSRDVFVVVGYLFVNIRDSFDILMDIGFGSNVLMHIGLCINFFVHIGLSFYLLVNIWNSNGSLSFLSSYLCNYFSSFLCRPWESKGRGEEERKELHLWKCVEKRP